MSRELKPYPEYKDSGVEWIGEVPEEWTTLKLSRVISVSSGKSVPVNKINKEITKITKYPVIGGNGIMGYTAEPNIKEYTISIGRVGALCGNVHYINFDSWITDNSLYITNYNHEKISLKYLSNVLKILNLNEYSTSTAQPLITSETVKRREVSLPPLNLQIKIANYIDQKTSEIDALIADKEKLITLLEEKRQAVITETVTKGLNPNVKLKDSGIEWIGEIPEHWEVVKVGHAFYITLGKMIQPSLKNKNEKQVPYLKAQNIQNSYINYDSIEKMFASPSEVDKYNIEKGDLLVCEGGEVGRSAIAEESLEDYIFQNALHRVRGSKNGNLYYLHYLLNIVRSSGYIDILVNKATIAHFTRDKFSSLRIPLPSYGEQNKIIEYLNKEVNDIKSVQQIIIEQISKLKEYRESLIYEAVTGKIDLRDYGEEPELLVAERGERYGN